MKDTILRASVETAANHGLNEWTVEEVANRAKCAKGLVNYHYRSKGELLSRTTETVAMDRLARRLSAPSRARSDVSKYRSQTKRSTAAGSQPGWDSSVREGSCA